jgi:cellulose synthase/poly-beta-1,6-N-acetylglucosamine synthase-like glycosyltransferase
MEFLPDFDVSLVFYLFCVFASLALIQLLYVLLIHGRLAFYKDKKQVNTDELVPVTVIIAARNESDNLFQNLPLILQQDYPIFEVIVVNHQSIDESYHILNAYKMQYPHLKVVEVERSKHLSNGKKLPLTLGIKAAKNEHLIFTDADCKPATNKWLKGMAEKFTPEKEIVIGYGPYQVQPGFLNKIIRLDTAMIALNYLSFALAKMPYMGVGRNLGYTRNVFNAVKGFKSHYSITSGDDDLFVQEAARKRNYTIQIDPTTFAVSKAKETWAEWKQQKSRHYSTSERYKVIKKGMLGIYPFTLLLLTISFVILMFNPEYRWISLAGFGFVTLVKWWIHGRCLAKLQAKSFIAWLPLLDIFYAILIPVMYYTAEKSTYSKWK